jgi:hypothetical protein
VAAALASLQTGLPEWLGGLTGLQTLNLGVCKGPTGLPEWLGGLTGLQMLNLQGCKGLTELPESLGGLTRPCSRVPGPCSRGYQRYLGLRKHLQPQGVI